MKKCAIIVPVGLFLLSFSSHDPKVIGAYRRYYKNEPASGHIFIKKDGVYSNVLTGGCDGRIEARGKWRINKDTLIVIDLEGRMMADPWKKTDAELRFLIEKGKLISFVRDENRIRIDSNQCYKKVKPKEAKPYE